MINILQELEEKKEYFKKLMLLYKMSNQKRMYNKLDGIAKTINSFQNDLISEKYDQFYNELKEYIDSLYYSSKFCFSIKKKNDSIYLFEKVCVLDLENMPHNEIYQMIEKSLEENMEQIKEQTKNILTPIFNNLSILENNQDLIIEKLAEKLNINKERISINVEAIYFNEFNIHINYSNKKIFSKTYEMHDCFIDNIIEDIINDNKTVKNVKNVNNIKLDNNDFLESFKNKLNLLQNNLNNLPVDQLVSINKKIDRALKGK